MSERSGRPLSISLVASQVRQDWHREALRHLEDANAAGLRVRAQVAPRPVGLIFGLDLTLNPFMTTAVWKEQLRDLPLTERVVTMRRAEVRANLCLRCNDNQVVNG